MRIGTLAGALLSTLAAAILARAATGPVTISVTCVELSAEERAHVEAMVRADLLARASKAWSVALECHPAWVTAEFDLGGGRVVTHGEPKASSRSQIAEQLIALSDRLISGDSDTASGGSAMGEPRFPTPPSGVAVPAPAAPTATGPSKATPDTDRVATDLTIGRNLRGVQADRGRVNLSGFVQPRQPITADATRDRLAFELSGAVQFDPVLSRTNGLLGPRLRVAAVAREQFAVNAMVALSWSLGAPNGYTMRDHRAGLGVDWRGNAHVTLGVTAMLTALHVAAPQGVTRNSAWSKLEPGAQVYLGYRAVWQMLGFEVGPALTVYAHPRIVRQDGSEVLALPVLLVGIVAQTAYRF